jgi:hypothetical protein
VVGSVDYPIGTQVAQSIAQSYANRIDTIAIATAANRPRPINAVQAASFAPIAVANVSTKNRQLDSGTFYGAGMALPVGEEDPIRRLEQIAHATAERKRSHINLLMSNFPGPPQHMYFAGAKILQVFQVGVIQGNVSLSVGVLSYAGRLNFDIVADANLVPDVSLFAEGMADDLERLGATSAGEGNTA